MKKYVVIVAGGSGSRMKSKLPKQFIEMGGLPILMHTINQFIVFDTTIAIHLVLPKAEMETWQSLCQKHNFSYPSLLLIEGGATRYQSCKNGIMAVKDLSNAIVAIHDGVRPFVEPSLIQAGFTMAQVSQTAVCSVEPKDSVRYQHEPNQHFLAINRNQTRLVQTPQFFQGSILENAYSLPEQSWFTDDASVVENAGYTINLFEGNYKNIKITTQEDLLYAQILLK